MEGMYKKARFGGLFCVRMLLRDSFSSSMLPVLVRSVDQA